MIKRWWPAAVPFAVSISLSLFTVGTHPYWQDSGLYLTAVKELGVLYPPGFVVYEVLCFLWTKVFFFLDFTLAVHLFSSLCAALAAGGAAIATRDLLRSKGRIFRVTEEDPGDAADACGALAGVILACGFTFWSAAIYAKGYSFYYLVLVLLLWRMIRADDSGRPRDFTIVAALIGLAWQAHPSAALAGPALLLFVAVHAKGIGWRGVAGRLALVAACAVGPSLLLLPWLTAREPWLMMGTPKGVGDVLAYLTGRRFVSGPGIFGMDGRRAASFGLFLWEELLGVGLALTAVGLAVLGSRRRLLFWGILAWMIPYAMVTILFKLEGQHDCWFVGAWLPLYLALGAGAWQAGRWAGQHARAVLLAAGVAATGWAVLANLSDVSQRNYLLSEYFGRTILDNVDRDAILVLQGDDANGIVSYLQRVRGQRPDVVLVTGSFLCHEAAGNWYDELLLRRHPFLRPPQYGTLLARFPQRTRKEVAAAAFLNENAEGGRPLFCEQLVPFDLIRPGYALIPAGAIWKLVRQSDMALDSRYWKFPIEPEQVPSKARRARGQRVRAGAGDLEVAPQRYEERLVFLLAKARQHLAIGLMEQGQPLAAARLCDSILSLDEEFRRSPEIVHLYAISLHAAGESARAEPALRRSAEISTIPRNKATASFYLGEIARKKGDEAEAQRCFAQALAVPDLDAATRREIESRLRPR